MAQLRHIAMTVADVAATRKFYEEVFGMTVLSAKSTSALLTDGVMTLAIVDKNSPAFGGHGFEGLHHIGFQVDDVEATRETIEDLHGKGDTSTPIGTAAKSVVDWSADDRERAKSNIRVATDEARTRDPNGIGVELVSADYAGRRWTKQG